MIGSQRRRGRLAPHPDRMSAARRRSSFPPVRSASRTPLALKLESLQVSGSFKGRGAFHKLLASKVPAAGIIAASGGNHGAAAAYAARALGHKAEIFVPTIASPTKVARLKSYGAIVHQVGAVYAEARAPSEKRAAETGALIVPAYEDRGGVRGRRQRRARVRRAGASSTPCWWRWAAAVSSRAAQRRSARARGSSPSRPRARRRCTKRCAPAIRSR